MHIELNCAVCGSNRFDYPVVLEDSSIIRCVDCGHVVGTVADLQQKVLQQLGRGSRQDSEEHAG